MRQPVVLKKKQGNSIIFTKVVHAFPRKKNVFQYYIQKKTTYSKHLHYILQLLLSMKKTRNQKFGKRQVNFFWKIIRFSWLQTITNFDWNKSHGKQTQKNLGNGSPYPANTHTHTHTSNSGRKWIQRQNRQRKMNETHTQVFLLSGLLLLQFPTIRIFLPLVFNAGIVWSSNIYFEEALETSGFFFGSN